ncbi:hypothetical protein PF003_g8544 [Phytophthora fragariae]|nr:hypothetical protein PF003_g8544 [Phytophthora fragariae]
MSELFGQSMVACVLDNLAGKKINPEVVARLLRGQRIKLYQKLQQGEHVLFHENHKIEPEKGEIKFVYREIWWGRSSVSETRNVDQTTCTWLVGGQTGRCTWTRCGLEFYPRAGDLKNFHDFVMYGHDTDLLTAACGEWR